MINIMQNRLFSPPKIIMPDPIWCSWFTGFIDGEGYFQIDLRKDHRGAFVALTITLREDDKNIIEEIHNKLLGDIYYVSYKHDRAAGRKSCNQWRWRIRDKNQIVNILIPLFDQYPLRTKKKKSYEIWREAALIIYENNHLGISGHNKMLMLRKNLKDAHRSPYLEQEINYFIADSMMKIPMKQEKLK